MPRIPRIDPEHATGRAGKLLDGVQDDWGMIPNVIRTLANSPAALDGYLAMASALAGGDLPAGLREQIAITVSQENRCDYCVAAHCAIAKAIGLSEDAVADARRGVSTDRKEEAALRFAQKMVAERGWVTNGDVARLRDSGFDDRQIIEIVANVAMTIFTNYFNHVADTEVDFPRIPQLSGT